MEDPKMQIIKNGRERPAGSPSDLLGLGGQGHRKPFDGSKFNLPASSLVESKPLIH